MVVDVVLVRSVVVVVDDVVVDVTTIVDGVTRVLVVIDCELQATATRANADSAADSRIMDQMTLARTFRYIA